MVIALAVAIPAAAAPKDSSRSVHFGSATTDDVLDITPGTVYPGGYVSFTAVAKNLGNQTLTHATFGLGSLAAPNVNTAATSLPAGWIIFSISPSAGSCTVDGTLGTTAAGAMCDFGSLVGRRGQASVDVVLHAATASANGVWASFKVSEQVNDNGANQDTFFASSGVTAAAACNTEAASKLPGNVVVHVEYNGGTCTASQSSKADMKAAGFTSGVLVHAVAGPNCRPGSGATCFGDFVSVQIVEVDGAAVVEWTVTWDASLLPSTFKLFKLGVLHFPDSGPTEKILATDLCTSATDTGCTIFAGFINGGAQLQMQFRTDENGVAKGFG